MEEGGGRGEVVGEGLWKNRGVSKMKGEERY